MGDGFSYDTESSDWHDSPVLRHYSEPLHHNHTNSIEASLSPAPSIHQTKCPWCGKYFETSDVDLTSQHDALKEHMALVHPRIARLSIYDGAGDEVEDKDVQEVEADGGDEDEMDEVPSIAEGDTAAATTEMDGEDEAEDEGDDTNGDSVETPLDDEVDIALQGQLHEFSRGQGHAAVEKRLQSFWNIHQARNFTEDYDEEIANLDHIWDHAYRESKPNKRADPADFPKRPNPYRENNVPKGEFLKITPVEEYLELLKNPEAMSHDELYAVTANAAHALRTWQDEWRTLDRLSKLANRQMMKHTADPRKPERPEVFEDKKEAMLYGYKYDPKASMVGIQDPFVQGGFRPTPAQLRKMRTTVAADNPNPDGWKPAVKFGVEHVPRFQNPPVAPFEAKNTRKRKAVQTEAAALLRIASEAKESTPATEADDELPPALRVTRTRGGRHLATREAPQAHTAPPSPAPTSRRGITSARGMRGGRGGRGRGASRMPQSVTSTPARSSTRVATARAAVVAPPSTTAGPTSAPAPAPTSARAPPTSSATAAAPAQTPVPAPIAPAPAVMPTMSAATSAALPTSTSALVSPGEVVDAVELARREKIAKSKNPRRTEAMLEHWARFIREGRVRNPKRTKAQIEADKAAEAVRKSSEPTKEPVPRKRKSGGPTTPKGPAAKRDKIDNPTGAPASLQPAPIQPATGPIAPPLPPPPTSNPPHATAYPPAPHLLAPPGMSPYGPINPHHMAPHYPNTAPPLMPNQQPPPLTHHHHMGYPANPPHGYPYIAYGGPPMPPHPGDRR
jgi:hypothetical protein